MSDDFSANLNMPLLQPAQAQKHVTHNEALMVLDALVMLTVISRHQILPPSSPNNGDRYIIPISAGADWGGQENALAAFSNGGWVFYFPREGWRAWVLDEEKEIVWHTGQWQDSGVKADMMGINADADTTNRLTVSAAATLLNHEGAGHQLKINKAAAQDTGSLLLQTGFSGRAEIGLAGEDALSIKTSSDGTNWQQVLRFDASSGLASGTAITQTPLDDSAARLLKAGDFGLGRALALTAGDLATLDLPNGFYSYDAADVAGGPENNHPHTLMVMQSPAAQTGGADQRVFLSMRNASALGAWVGQQTQSGSAITWHPLYTAQSIVGAVSQNGGRATGAVIERGQNSDGSYTRFADGTQICTQELSASASSPTTWRYPIAFSAAPAVSGNARAAACAAVVLDQAPNATSAALSVRGANDNRRADTVSLIAIGRWY